VGVRQTFEPPPDPLEQLDKGLQWLPDIVKKPLGIPDYKPPKKGLALLWDDVRTTVKWVAGTAAAAGIGIAAYKIYKVVK
jgi:hypothetical protein